MPEPPKAHRRLVPRKPRKTEEPPDHPVEPADSMEMTETRPGIDAEDLEVTVRRAPAPLSPDDVMFDDLGDEPPTNAIDDDNVMTADPDAGETFSFPANAPPRGSFVLHAPPDVDDDPQPEEFPKSSRSSVPHFKKQVGLPLGLDAASAKFKPAATVMDDHSPPIAPSVAPPISDIDAFADLEPTALKTSNLSHDIEERPTTHISPAERGLLAAMSEGHEASRLVYMNWLERRGEKQRAEYLKLDHTLATMNPLDIRYQETQDRLRELAEKVSVDWRSRVARSLIENCHSGSRCPTHWRSLPAVADDVRQCGACGQQVFYCVTIDLARQRVQAGQPIAIDVAVERARDDLEPRCVGCNSTLPQNTRFCPHCGRSAY